jgi:hypothetical protein
MDRIQVLNNELDGLKQKVSRIEIFLSEYVLPSGNIDREFLNLVKSGDKKGLSLWRKRKKVFNQFYGGQS